ncbi:MFS transporter [Hydrogenophaga sp. NFH-34]|uniref:MFS transporter n=1 Tax=Hydrogenophaga sp. NFH-34 TaxID=2744446 RepID=UPI001F38BEDC|nr:MFS transporter [Hydrogenophaga sp. NFH-34]
MKRTPATARSAGASDQPLGPAPVNTERLPARTAVAVFLAFALAYFLSALVRAVTATLSPILSEELALHAGDLGLLAGGYFLGFALTQLPLGTWLDRFGPRRVILAFLTVAVAGCAAFALATSFGGLLAARVLTGMGVSACLMAPLTGFRRWLPPSLQLRANSWMLMTGSLGMVAATLPVQWLLPQLGWRGLFWGLAVLIALSMLVLRLRVPAWQLPSASPAADAEEAPNAPMGYGEIARHPYFRQMVTIGFINYGGMIAIQTLWAGPWMVQVTGYTPAGAAQGLFGINLSMLTAFWLWGVFNPRLVRAGWSAERLIAWGMPLSLGVLGAIVALGGHAGWGFWAAFCMTSTFGALAQPAVGMALPAHVAGKALSAYNLVIFAGVFAMQWAIGLAADALVFLGDGGQRLRGAMGLFWLACVAGYVMFWLAWRRANRRPAR